jgi:hypothetical protein
VGAAAHSTLQPNHTNPTLGSILGDLNQIRYKLEMAIAGPHGTESLGAIENLMRLWSCEFAVAE